jgi:hypothetical protein
MKNLHTLNINKSETKKLVSTSRGINNNKRGDRPVQVAARSRRRSAAARLLRLWVRIPPGAWMSVVSVVCCHVEASATS